MFALLQLMLCGWHCTMFLSKETYPRKIILQASRHEERNNPHSEPTMIRYALSIKPWEAGHFKEIIEDGWERLYGTVVERMKIEQEKTSPFAMEYIPLEALNREFLEFLGFKTDVRMVHYDLHFSVTREGFHHEFSLTQTEVDNALRNHPSKPEVYNFFWGVMIQELIEKGQIKER